jgi:glycosyltransferase involved in cell wall biosynthesis
VRVTGFVSDSDRDALYAGAVCLVFPSLYEGFGLPILEAMAMGAPVIASNSSAMPEVAGHAALLVDPKSPAEIAAAIRSVIEDDGLAARLSSAGRKRALRFSWDVTAASVLQVYARLANTARPR